MSPIHPLKNAGNSGCRRLSLRMTRTRARTRQHWGTLSGRGGSPDLYGVIPTTGGNVPAIRGPRQRSYSIAMSRVGEEGCSRERVPDPHGVVPTTGSNKLTVGRPGQGAYITGVFLISVEKLARKGLQDAHRFVSETSCYVSSIGGPGQ